MKLILGLAFQTTIHPILPVLRTWSPNQHMVEHHRLVTLRLLQESIPLPIPVWLALESRWLFRREAFRIVIVRKLRVSFWTREQMRMVLMNQSNFRVMIARREIQISSIHLSPPFWWVLMSRKSKTKEKCLTMIQNSWPLSRAKKSAMIKHTTSRKSFKIT